MKIYIINGHPRAGKDTFVKFCGEFAPTANYSTVDIIKKFAYECGWDGEKTPESRKYLSDLKDLMSEWLDTSFNKAIEAAFVNDKIKHKDFMFIHSREPEEIDRFKNYFRSQGYVCKTIKIVRTSGSQDDFSNHADELVDNYKYDLTLMNQGTLGEFRMMAGFFVEHERHSIN